MKKKDLLLFFVLILTFPVMFFSCGEEVETSFENAFVNTKWHYEVTDAVKDSTFKSNLEFLSSSRFLMTDSIISLVEKEDVMVRDTVVTKVSGDFEGRASNVVLLTYSSGLEEYATLKGKNDTKKTLTVTRGSKNIVYDEVKTSSGEGEQKPADPETT